MDIAMYLICLTVGMILGVSVCIYIDQIAARKT